MSLRLDSCVLRGEIDNSVRNTIGGWIEVTRDTVQEDRRRTCFLLSLTGNLSGVPAGSRLRFEVRNPQESENSLGIDSSFQQQQIGVLCDCRICLADPAAAAAPAVTTTEASAADVHSGSLASLYLSWNSQNGPVTLELLDTSITFLEPGSGAAPFGIHGLPEGDLPAELKVFIQRARRSGGPLTDDVEEPPAEYSDGEDQEDDSEPFQLFDQETQDLIRESAKHGDEELDDDRDDVMMNIPQELRDLVQSISPNASEMFAQWNDVLQGKHDEPLSWVLDEPLRLPVADQLKTDEEAWDVLGKLLSALALKGVAFDMCPHTTPVQAYRILTEILLPEARIHPDLPGTGFVCHFTSGSYCEQCRGQSSDQNPQD